ncbi:MAG TPA: hypothetical protein VF495_26675 [Phenylobacterium sp.]
MVDDDDTVDPNLAWLLELRLRSRGNRPATQIIDRCLALCALNPPASLADLESLQAEIQAIADTLALTYGAPQARVLS